MNQNNEIKEPFGNKIKDYILGKARKEPCKICGNPYHFTNEHKRFD